MSRPSTQGCTEWSCPYHGGDNRFKSAHAAECPIRASDRFVFDIADAIRAGELPPEAGCQCAEGALLDPRYPVFDLGPFDEDEV